MQAKLLRLIQDGELYPVGEETPTQIDVRVLAATNRDLEREVAAGRFRADLFWRLNVIPVELPSLRERPADIVPLTAALPGARQRAEQAGRGGLRSAGAGAARSLSLAGQHPRAGERRRARRDRKARGTIGVADLPAAIRTPRNPTPKETPVVGLPEDGTDLRAMLEAVEARMIEEALERTERQQEPRRRAARPQPHDAGREAAPQARRVALPRPAKPCKKGLPRRPCLV